MYKLSDLSACTHLLLGFEVIVGLLVAQSNVAVRGHLDLLHLLIGMDSGGQNVLALGVHLNG